MKMSSVMSWLKLRCPGLVDDEARNLLILEHMECRDTQISCMAARSLAEPLEACRPQGGLKLEAPRYPGIPGRAIRRTPHREAFIPDVKSLGAQYRLAGLLEHTDLGRSSIWGTQLGWQGCRHTEVLRDLGIKVRQPQGGRFGV
jgi:hypothetical protein